MHTQTTGTWATVAPSSDYAEAMSVLASGVVMVTTELGGRPWGMTVSAFASVSLAPSLISVCIDHSASMYGALCRAERFVDAHARGVNPVVDGALAHLDCDVVDQVEVADHTILFARVREVRGARCGEPLVYFRRAYRTLVAHSAQSLRRRTPCLSS